MQIWALADFHLSFGIPNKKMDVFGSQWLDHAEKIRLHCQSLIKEEDLLLISGDLSWALKLDQVEPDLAFIDSLPGTKLISKGNHDYWWPSDKKLKEILPKSLISTQHQLFIKEDIAIIGVRLWDDPSFNCHSLVDFQENPKKNKKKTLSLEDSEKIFNKELIRLELALQKFPKNSFKILMCHYPPLDPDLNDSKASALIEKYGVNICVFGHLHQIKPLPHPPFGEKNGVLYALTSCDALNFKPLLIKQSKSIIP